MGQYVLKENRIWLAEHAIRSDVSGFSFGAEAEEIDNTVFGNTTRSARGGLKTLAASLEGMWNADGASGSDTVLFSKIGTANVPLTVSAGAGADADNCYFLHAMNGSYTPLSGTVGEMARFNVTAVSTDGSPIVRGTIMLNATATSSASGTAREIGAVSATQKVYAALHVIAASGTTPTLDVVVQSDSAEAMSSPTSRITFTQATAETSQFSSAAGAITDTWWQVDYTIGGTSPSFEFVVAVGII